MLQPTRALLLLLASTWLAPLARAAETHVVTTYVVKTQDEREQTRWTLTEWLRIKERMKMMDVWLAMFSDPKKDRFEPELMLSYDYMHGRFHDGVEGANAADGTYTGTAGKAQLWLTNLISSTVGVRMLNVDLGVEGYKRTTGTSAATSTAAIGQTPTTMDAGQQLQTVYYTGDLRIFGKNIQDSSIVLKYGQYSSTDHVLDGLTPGAGGDLKGTVAGAELQLYLLKFLGAEGSYLHFGDAAGPKGTSTLGGEYYDYMGFVEISLLRLTAGVYGESWALTRGGQVVKTQEKGTLAGLKLQF